MWQEQEQGDDSPYDVTDPKAYALMFLKRRVDSAKNKETVKDTVKICIKALREETDGLEIAPQDLLCVVLEQPLNRQSQESVKFLKEAKKCFDFVDEQVDLPRTYIGVMAYWEAIGRVCCAQFSPSELKKAYSQARREIVDWSKG